MFADFDGVVVVPKAMVNEVIELASDKVRRENSSRAELMQGAYLRDVYKKYGVLSKRFRPAAGCDSALPALPLEAGAVSAKLDQSALFGFRDIGCPSVRTAKADIGRHFSQYINLFQNLAGRRYNHNRTFSVACDVEIAVHIGTHSIHPVIGERISKRFPPSVPSCSMEKAHTLRWTVSFT